jgi:hypothetical protein
MTHKSRSTSLALAILLGVTQRSVSDRWVMLASRGPSPSVPAADLSGDGVVDGVDLGMPLAAWGSCQE